MTLSNGDEAAYIFLCIISEQFISAIKFPSGNDTMFVMI